MGLLDIFRKILKKDCTNTIRETQDGKEFQVIFPPEGFSVGDVMIDKKPYVFMLNSNLLLLKHKELFPWYLSFAMKVGNPNTKGMPEGDELTEMQDFCEQIDKIVKADSAHPNAVYIGRITGNGWIQAMWYVNNPDKTNEQLQSIIKSGDYPFDFDFQITKDSDWKEAHYWLDPLSNRK